ncbi:Gfo/Idh/MocA family protein [Acidicapsa ligni]|uniref:Gfo/Idh/MocA family protein n=1 Tax=Acidicapsa ligni TaxID=542300 RepID=UPI0021E010F6|nr:Gfo/Idh/MocA family oxidoreductase [Acidicapsa ligni]
MRVAVVGTGAFGRNHLRVYKELASEGVTLVAAVEPDAGRAAEVTEAYGIPVFASVEAALSADLKLDAASVAVPTVHHHAAASQLLSAGVDCLVEKPITASLSEADDLIALAEKHERVLQPGHLERFNPAVLAIEPALTRPMFFEAHRLSIFTPRSLDVDVVLDLMIHDLDVVLTFANSPVKEVRAVGLPILSPKVDIANVRVEFESGCVANFTASRVSTERVRKLRFFEPRQYVSIDYARKDVLVIAVDAEFSIEKAMALGAAAGFADGLPGLSFTKPEVAPGEPLRLEICSFLDAVRSRKTPRVTARQGREALALALEIQRAMEVHAGKAGLASFFSTT